jgi:hypothetical protein
MQALDIDFESKEPQMNISSDVADIAELDFSLSESLADFFHSRTTIREQMVNGSTIRPGQTMKFKLPDDEHLVDLNTVYLALKVQLYGNGAFPELRGSIQRKFNRMVVKTGNGTILEEVEDYGTVADLQHKLYLPYSYRTNFLQAEGIYSDYRQYSVNPSAVKLAQTAIYDANNTITLNANNADGVSVGDIVYVEGNTAVAAETKQRSHIRLVTARPAANTITVDEAFPYASDIQSPIWVLGNRSTNPSYSKLNSAYVDSKTGGAQSATAGQGRWMVFKLDASGFFNAEKLFPLWLTNGLQLEMTLHPQARSVDVPTVANPGQDELRILDGYLHYEAVRPRDVIVSALNTEFSTGLNMEILTWERNQKILNQTNSHNHKIENDISHANKIYWVRRSADVDTTSGLDQDYVSTQYSEDDASWWQFESAKIKYPYDPVYRPVVSFVEMAKGAEIYDRLTADFMSLEEYESTSHINVLDLVKFYDETGDDKNTGHNISQNPVNFTLRLDNALTADEQLDFFIQHKQIIKLMKGSAPEISS